MRYVLAQINPTVGDLSGNSKKILEAYEKAQEFAPDLVVFPELSLCGCPPDDLLRQPEFLTETEQTMHDITVQIHTHTIIGYPAHPFFAGHPRLLVPIPPENLARPYDTAAIISEGRIVGEYHKSAFSPSAVVAKAPYFQPGNRGLNIILKNSTAQQKVGIVIGDDAAYVPAGAEVVIILAAAPFHRRHSHARAVALAELARRSHAHLLYCNLVGGADKLVFDGHSLAINSEGEITAQARGFAEDLLVIDIPENPAPAAPQKSSGRPTDTLALSEPIRLAKVSRPAAPLYSRPAEYDETEEVYQALVLGLRDYVGKNGFPGAILGLSGGIDSALVAAIAVDALGADKVFGVTMPSRFSSAATRDDAEILAKNLNIRFASLPIAKPYAAFEEMLTPLFADALPERDAGNLTPQNLQARIRAVYLMALANKHGLLLLNTSNKSESAVGYGTLYGDMAGGFAVIKDVYKTDVWKLSRYVNAWHQRELIPVSTIERIPTAELRENQEDRQSLPDYPILDPILMMYIEEGRTFTEIVNAGYDCEIVSRIIALNTRSEFKRRQAALGTLITPKPAAKRRRTPVTNKFRP